MNIALKTTTPMTKFKKKNPSQVPINNPLIKRQRFHISKSTKLAVNPIIEQIPRIFPIALPLLINNKGRVRKSK